MYDIKTFKSDSVKESRDKVNNSLNVINGEYPTFNRCGHTTIDLSAITKLEDENMHTLSIKLDNDGTYLTVCVIPINKGNYINMDVKIHSLNDKRTNRAIHFGPSGSIEDVTKIDSLNLLALISEVKK